MNIYDFAIQYQDDLWLEPTHKRNCLMQVRRFNEWQALDLDEVTAPICIAYRHVLQEQQLAVGTINRHLSAISAVLSFAVKMGIIKQRPNVGMLHEGEADTKAFTKDQVRQMIQHHDDNGDQWVADMIRLACLTGMRLGEIVALPTLEIDQRTKELWLAPQVTKTSRGRYVSLAAGDALAAAVRLQTSIKTNYTDKKFRNRWDDVKSRMGFRTVSWFKFHACRHFAATNMAKAQMNVLVVADQLGHRSLQTTQKYYHGDAEARAAAVSALTF